MTISEMIRNLGKNKKEFKEKLKQAQEEDKIQRVLEERKKSSNQREVERYMKEKEEEEYKMILDRIRKRKNRDLWSSSSGNILKQRTNVLHGGRSILKEKNIFTSKGDLHLMDQKGGMFFQ